VSKLPTRICVTPRLRGVGGMVSFQARLVGALEAHGIEVTFDPADLPYRSALIIGGTRQLAGLIQARRRGVRIVQRLDGMNWIHRQRRTGLRHYLRAEYGNWLLELIRSRIARHIVYQSQFSRDWWERVHGKAPATCSVVYNGVDLAVYSPEGTGIPPDDKWRILMVEGSLMGGYEQGLESGMQLAAGLMASKLGKPVEMVIAGKVAPQVRAAADMRAGELAVRGSFSIQWLGLVDRNQIPELDRSAHVLFSSDINPACPNSVIEALACGCPVVAYNTGALPELVIGDSGRLANYGGDPWKLGPPDHFALVRSTLPVLHEQDRFRRSARSRAENDLSLEQMIDGYLAALLG